MKTTRKKVIRVWSVLLVLVMMVTVIQTGGMAVEAKSKSKKIAILYFSATGTTKAVAKKIKKRTKGQLIELKASNPYTEEDLDWTEEQSRVTVEHESAESPAKSTVRPKIKNLGAIKKAVKKADVVYIGASDIIRTS